MKRFILSCLVVITFGAYVIIQRLNGANQNTTSAIAPLATANKPLTSSSSSPSSSPTTTTPYSSSKINSDSPQNISYKDGQFTGTPANAYYGNVQVKAIIKNGKITDVQFLDYPQDRSTSVAINRQVMPYLKQEAIQTQNSQVDVVSGATLTSEAFRQSLHTALTQAL